MMSGVDAGRLGLDVDAIGRWKLAPTLGMATVCTIDGQLATS
jgi:hypothetical protein